MPRAGSEPKNPIALNLAKIVYRLLTEPRGWEVRSLMRDLGIKPRTYRKYKKLLQTCDFLTRNNESLVYEVRDGETTWLRLRPEQHSTANDSEILARVLADCVLRSLGCSEIANRSSELFSAFATKLGSRTYVYREVLRDVKRKIFYLCPPPKNYSTKTEIIRKIVHALLHYQRIRVSYEAVAGHRDEILEPLTLILWNGGLYLVARKQGSRKPLLFVVDRFKSVKTTSRFRYPAESEYSPEKYCDGYFGIFHEDRAPVEVELIFAPKRWIHMYLTERLWHPTQQFELLQDGRLRMTFQTRQLVEVGRFIRSFGPDVEVVKPDMKFFEPCSESSERYERKTKVARNVSRQ